MSIDTYEDIDNNLYSGIAGFEIAYSSANKEAIRKAKQSISCKAKVGFNK